MSFPNPPPRRSRGDSPIFVVDSDTSECLHYEPAFAYPKKKLAHIPREVLNEHKQVEVRYDLIDCGIDVCSFEVCLSIVWMNCSPACMLMKCDV